MEQIKLEDKSYPEKRKIFREYALKEEISACIDCVADEIHTMFHQEMIRSCSSSISSAVATIPMEWLTIKH